MTFRMIRKAVSITFFTLASTLATHAAFAADQCAPMKKEVECSKKAGCKWNGKACATAKASKAATEKSTSKTGADKSTAKAGAEKPAAKTTSKSGGPKAKAAAKAVEKKPVEQKPVAPAEVPMEDDMPASDGDAEDF